MQQQEIFGQHTPNSMKVSYVIDELAELQQAVKCLQQLVVNVDMQMIAYHLHLAQTEALEIQSGLGSVRETAKAAVAGS